MLIIKYVLGVAKKNLRHFFMLIKNIVKNVVSIFTIIPNEKNVLRKRQLDGEKKIPKNGKKRIQRIIIVKI
jgi:hypothetical protein